MKRSWGRRSAWDVVVVGGGVAGLSAALALAPRKVCILTKGRFGSGGSSPLAQGGVAAAVGENDSPRLHAADTLAVARGLAVAPAVRALMSGAAAEVRRLAALGTRFDRHPNGSLALGREAGHRRPRILHAGGDATGLELMRALGAAARRAEHVAIEAETEVLDLAVRDGAVVGLLIRGRDGAPAVRACRAVILATGGIGHLWARTTNPPEATGDGLAMAARAGALLADLEFVQFHPTALAAGDDPMPLVTEALRGRGARLVDGRGRRFMTAVHPDAELAPRDVVARALWERLESGEEVFLDATNVSGLAEAFPTVLRLCRERGLDPRRERIPVSPAAHYHMGGVWTDVWGRTSLPGLWACGEVASSGVHGANRLASNSLLEALVFGERAARDVARWLERCPVPISAGPLVELPAREEVGTGAAESRMRRRTALRELMWRAGGVVRSGEGLEAGLEALGSLGSGSDFGSAARENRWLVAWLVLQAALARRESRGSHQRSDHPRSDPRWASRRVVRLGEDGELLAAGAEIRRAVRLGWGRQ